MKHLIITFFIIVSSTAAAIIPTCRAAHAASVGEIVHHAPSAADALVRIERYDDRDRLIRTFDYTYDNRTLRVTQIEEQRPHPSPTVAQLYTSRFTYDNHSRLTTVVINNAWREEYTYHGNTSQLLQIRFVDAARNRLHAHTSFVHDAQGRVLQRLRSQCDWEDHQDADRVRGVYEVWHRRAYSRLQARDYNGQTVCQTVSYEYNGDRVARSRSYSHDQERERQFFVYAGGRLLHRYTVDTARNIADELVYSYDARGRIHTVLRWQPHDFGKRIIWRDVYTYGLSR